MADFSYSVPDTVPAGGHVWQIKNNGTQWHEMEVLKPHPGLTKEQFMQIAQAAQPPSGAPPFDTVAWLKAGCVCFSRSRLLIQVFSI
jgi:hypothetical protein